MIRFVVVVVMVLVVLGIVTCAISAPISAKTKWQFLVLVLGNLNCRLTT